MVRSYIEKLKEEDITIFLCTHNLEEASNLSDVVCIIKSKIIKISTLDELQKNRKGKKIEILLKDNSSKYLDLIKHFKEIIYIKTDKNKISLSLENPELINPIIIKKLVEAGAEILYFNEIKASLEEIYLELIKN